MNKIRSRVNKKHPYLLYLLYRLLAPLWILATILACIGTSLTALPQSTCPTDIPPTLDPFATPVPTDTVPLPTLPPPTPHVITSPQDFYVGDAVFVGVEGSPQQVRFRLISVETRVVGEEQITTWQLEVMNAGTADYAIFPAVQMVLSEIETASGIESSAWASSSAAGELAGVAVDGDYYTLPPEEVRVFQFAAFTPVGVPYRFTFTLDPNVAEDSPVMTWLNQMNPYCGGVA